MMKLWTELFGRTELFGVNIGFWVALAAVAVIVIVMNIVFWSMKPSDRRKDGGKPKAKR